MRKAWILLPLAAALGGCGLWPKEDAASVSAGARQVDFQANESRTLSSLANIEESLKDYVQSEKKAPDSLEDLIPKYLAEMPTVELGLPNHKDTSQVEDYPASVLGRRHIDGSQLKDTGRWGYAHDDHRAVVFVDCTHKSSRGKSWYLERNGNP
jgi:hypothetical protein